MNTNRIRKICELLHVTQAILDCTDDNKRLIKGTSYVKYTRWQNKNVQKDIRLMNAISTSHIACRKRKKMTETLFSS